MKKKILYFLPLSFVFFYLSLLLLSYYTKGDQVWYTNLYEAFKSTSFSNVLFVAKQQVNGVEPISAYLLWLGAQIGVEKNIFISFLNVLLLVGLCIFMQINRVKLPIQALVLTNFYVLVLLTGAERLKISYIFLIYSTIFAGRISSLLALISPLAHLQSFILLVGFSTYRIGPKFISFLTNLRIKAASLPVILLFGSLFSLIAVYLFNSVVLKASGYLVSGFDGLIDLIRYLPLLIVALIVSRKDVGTTLMLFVMGLAVILLGGDRVNMIAFSLYLYTVILRQKTNHPLIVLLLSYFSFKSLFFIDNVIKYGDGFV